MNLPHSFRPPPAPGGWLASSTKHTQTPKTAIHSRADPLSTSCHLHGPCTDATRSEPPVVNVESASFMTLSGSGELAPGMRTASGSRDMGAQTMPCYSVVSNCVPLGATNGRRRADPISRRHTNCMHASSDDCLKPPRFPQPRPHSLPPPAGSAPAGARAERAPVPGRHVSCGAGPAAGAWATAGRRHWRQEGRRRSLCAQRATFRPVFCCVRRPRQRLRGGTRLPVPARASARRAGGAAGGCTARSRR